MEQAEYQQAVSAFHRALEVKPDDAETLYNLACLFSLWARADEALAYLERAIAGDEKLRAKARGDEDFANIREAPRFRKLVGLE
jgi:tetratricopeptide (TPR) repeat protein